jgi:hypothetical protein
MNTLRAPAGAAAVLGKQTRRQRCARRESRAGTGLNPWRNRRRLRGRGGAPRVRHALLLTRCCVPATVPPCAARPARALSRRLPVSGA